MNAPRHSVVQVVSLGVASAQILPPNEIRTAILFTPLAATAYSVANQPLAALGQGINIQAAGEPVLIRREDFGDIVCHAWHGIAGGAAVVGVLIAYEEP